MTEPSRTGFFPMPKGDLVYLIAVLSFTFIAFMPWARGIQWGGVALVGWLMAALMVVSPLLALARIRAETRQKEPDRD